jgi:DNA-binding transcriptional regulator YbjK
MTNLQDNIPNSSDLEDLRTWILTVLETFDSVYKNRFAALDSLQEQTEQRLAMLTSAYAESVVLIEALLNQFVGASEQDRERFRNDVTEGRKKMLEVLQNAARDVEHSSEHFTSVDPSSPS